jgi:dihydroorotate dehydrogenase (fumarate)
LEHLRRTKAAVAIPVVASLNGMTAESWLTFAQAIEQAGADALELNIYEMVADPNQGAMAIEAQIRDIVVELKKRLTIPIAVKLSPFFTAFANVAQALDQAGADGLVLFNRFFEPDFDIDAMTTLPRLELSTSAELALRLQWTALLHGRIRASIAVSGGVVSPSDGIKALLAGADAVQLVSAILRHGPAYFTVMRDGLTRWMASNHIATLSQVRGRLSAARGTRPAFFERGQYIRTLHSGPWRGPSR